MPASHSGLLIDSKGRSSSESPYHFIAPLSAAVACDALTYKNLSWCQAIYTHSAVSSPLMFDILQTENPSTGATTNKWYPGFANGEDYLNTHYVIYHKPYQYFNEFDGNEDSTSGGPYKAPQFGSYAHDVETALNVDIRITTNNLIPVNATSLSTAFPGIQFYFRYSASQGFRLTADYVNFAGNRVPCPIRLWDCPSIQIAHRVHGFGIPSTWNPLEINTGKITSLQDLRNSVLTSMVTKKWLPAWIVAMGDTNNLDLIIKNGGFDLSSPTLGYSLVNNSDSTPTLIPIKTVQIYCPELTFNKKLQSYRNIGAVCKYGNNEIATFPLTLAAAMKMTTLTAGTDANVWSFREGYSPQQLTMIMVDEDGNDLISSNCWMNFLQKERGTILELHPLMI